MSIKLAICVVICHFAGDWLMQSRHLAVMKSRSVPHLVHHVWLVALFLTPIVPIVDKIAWLFAYAVLHGLQDWYLWRIAKRWVSPDEYWLNKRFYDTIAFDQALHLVTLFLCLEYIP